MNPSLPLVSAIIPTHNRPEMLIRAVRSVIHQTYRNIEIIIVDDSSDYDVEDWIRKEIEFHACRIFKNMRKPGAAGARNTGFYESKGAFVGFLDNDDEWALEKIEKQIEVFQKSDSRVGIVCTHDVIIRGPARHTRRRCLTGNVYANLCIKHIAGNTSNPLIRRSVLEDVGLFDEDLPAAQDTDLWLRIAKHYDFATVEEPLVFIYCHDLGRITGNSQKQLRGAYALLRKYWKEFPMQRKYMLMKRIVRKALATARE